jgi:hypothetical protein
MACIVRISQEGRTGMGDDGKLLPSSLARQLELHRSWESITITYLPPWEGHWAAPAVLFYDSHSADRRHTIIFASRRLGDGL